MLHILHKMFKIYVLNHVLYGFFFICEYFFRHFMDNLFSHISIYDFVDHFCFAHLWTFNDPHFMVHRLIDVRFDFSFFFVLYLFIVGGRPEEKETINLSYRRKGDYQFILLLLCPWGLVSLSFIFFQHPLIKHIVNPLEHCTHCQRRYMDSLA